MFSPLPGDAIDRFGKRPFPDLNHRSEPPIVESTRQRENGKIKGVRLVRRFPV
jgi:hypothetical protein